MPGLNLWSDVSSIARAIQEGAYHVIRENALMQSLVFTYTDMQGMNLRKTYKFNQMSAKAIGEDDDLTSEALTPELDQTFTPSEIGLQFFVPDSRRDSEAPEDIIRDGALELGYAAADQVETNLIGELANLTGGTIGAAGTTITWGYVAAAIARARNASKSAVVPLTCVIHGYQAAVLAKTASVAGATSIAQAPVTTEQITRAGLVQAFTFMGVPIMQSFASPNTNDDFVGGVFRRECIAIDWRRRVRVEPQRDASRRGEEFNMSAIYAHGPKRPTLGIQMLFDATAPSS